jgi:hypothetical protein
MAFCTSPFRSLENWFDGIKVAAFVNHTWQWKNITSITSKLLWKDGAPEKQYSRTRRNFGLGWDLGWKQPNISKNLGWRPRASTSRCTRTQEPWLPPKCFPGTWHVLDPAGKQDIQRHVIVHEPANSAPKKHVAAAHEVILVALTKRKFPLESLGQFHDNLNWTWESDRSDR